jgi:hypothetical protein
LTNDDARDLVQAVEKALKPEKDHVLEKNKVGNLPDRGDGNDAAEELRVGDRVRFFFKDDSSKDDITMDLDNEPSKGERGIVEQVYGAGNYQVRFKALVDVSGDCLRKELQDEDRVMFNGDEQLCAKLGVSDRATGTVKKLHGDGNYSVRFKSLVNVSGANLRKGATCSTPGCKRLTWDGPTCCKTCHGTRGQGHGLDCDELNQPKEDSGTQASLHVWLSKRRDNDKWEEYTEEIQVRLEDAWKKKEEEEVVSIEIAGAMYKVNFSTMEQTNVADPSRMRDVKRDGTTAKSRSVLPAKVTALAYQKVKDQRRKASVMTRAGKASVVEVAPERLGRQASTLSSS